MKTVLIIEDDPKVAEALRIRFESQSYQVLLTYDAVQGRNFALQRKPDLLVLDIALPGGDGLALAADFRELPETRTRPVIFVTGSRDPELRKKAMELNAFGLLEKPYDPEELLALAQFALGRENTALSAQRTLSGSEEANHTTESTGWNESPDAVKRILIIEDDENIAKALSLRLKSVGYETRTASDALLGVSTAVQFCPDLVLLDISMPAGDGFQVAERLRSILPAHTPIIFLTASKKPEFLERAHQLGVEGYFEKPFDAETLLTSIRQVLGEPAPAR